MLRNTVVFLLVACTTQAQHIYSSSRLPYVKEWVYSTPVESPKLQFTIDTVNGWMDWHFVNNFEFGKDRGSLPMIADLRSLHPYFRDQVAELFRRAAEQNITLAIVETYRTRAKQGEYSGMGKGYTSTGPGRSKHQYGLAIDVVPLVDSIAVWDNKALWLKVGIIGEQLGLRWGGRWKSPYDPGHFEWSGSYTSTELVKGLFPPVPDPAKYPDLDKELRLLKKFWNHWEAEQSLITRNTPKR